MERLEHLGDLGLHQQLHVHRDLAERRGDEAEEAADLADPVAHRMPGDLGLAEAELGHQGGLHLEAVAAERGQRAGRAAELADQDARPSSARRARCRCMAARDGRDLVAEGDRHRLLQVAPPRHRGVAVAPRQVGERSGNRRHVLLDEAERLAHLHHGRGVGDVLGGGAPVAPFAQALGAFLHDLLHHRQHRIADALGLLLELDEVDVLDLAGAFDLDRRLSRNDAEPRLHPRQRRLELEIELDPPLVGEHAAHRFGGENVAEDDRVECRGRHDPPFPAGLWLRSARLNRRPASRRRITPSACCGCRAGRQSRAIL